MTTDARQRHGGLLETLSELEPNVMSGVFSSSCIQILVDFAYDDSERMFLREQQYKWHGFNTADPVIPAVHYRAVFVYGFSVVVRRFNLIPFGMRKLPLNDLWPESHLMQPGRCRCAEAVSSH